MKIRQRKKPTRPTGLNLAWFMAATAMMQFSAAAPESIWAKQPNTEDPFDRKNAGRPDRWGKDPDNPYRPDDRWQPSEVPFGRSLRDIRHRLIAQLTDKERPIVFNIPPQPLSSALLLFSEQSSVQLAYTTEDIQGVDTVGVSGMHTVEKALALLLANTGIQYRVTGSNTITLEKGGASMAPGTGVEDGAMKGSDQPAGQLPAEPPPKPIKVPEVVVKDVREKPTWTTPVDGYKADHASTVTRSTMSIDETPTSIGVVTRDVIRDTFARTQADAFEAVSGVSRSNSSQGRAEDFAIRGFDANDNLNGMKANGLPTDGLFAPDWGIVERYEIVKGPASIVGGAANPGGIVNRITKTPQRSNFTTVEANFGSYDFYRGLIDANGIMPKYDNIRGRLVFAVEEGGNFVNFTPARQYTVAPSVEFDLFKGAGKLLLIGTYQSFDGASYPGWPLASDGKMLNVPRTRNFGGGAPNGARTAYTGYNGEIHYDHKFLHDIKLSAKGKYSQSDLSDKSIYSYTPYGQIPGGIPSNGESYVNAGLRQTRVDTYAGELTLSKEFALLGQKHEVLAGADHRDMTRNFALHYSYLPVGGPFVLDNVFNPRNTFHAPPDSVLIAASPPFATNVNLKQTGAFGQLIARPFERLTIVAAGRHDSADSTHLDKTTGVQSEQTKSAWTGRFGATFKVTSWMNVYGGIQQSFLPQPLTSTRDRQLLEPETGINYEIGAKWNFLEERLRITTALFRTYRRNVATPDPSDFRFSIAVGEQRHQGVEFDINGQPIPGLNLNANVTYLDAEVTEDTRPEFVGSYPTRIPQDYFGRVFATYQLQSGPLTGFGFGGGVYFQGGYDLSVPNRIGTDNYQRVDAVVFYRGDKRYDVSVNIRNLLDKTYIESPGNTNAFNGFGAPISAFGTVRVYF